MLLKGKIPNKNTPIAYTINRQTPNKIVLPWPVLLIGKIPNKQYNKFRR